MGKVVIKLCELDVKRAILPRPVITMVEVSSSQCIHLFLNSVYFPHKYLFIRRIAVVLLSCCCRVTLMLLSCYCHLLSCYCLVAVVLLSSSVVLLSSCHATVLSCCCRLLSCCCRATVVFCRVTVMLLSSSAVLLSCYCRLLLCYRRAAGLTAFNLKDSLSFVHYAFIL